MPCNAMAVAMDPLWAMVHVRPWQWSWEFCHGMSWLSVTYSRGHAMDAPWPRLGEYAMVTRGLPWSPMGLP